jgi:mRNA-degrading endonuclease HigB of HigAB toxin-antitoxin module
MKNIITKNRLKKVQIYWRDAVSHAEWLSPEEAKKYLPAINYTEGYLLEKNKNSTIVFMSCNDTDIGDTTVIPTENIKQIKFVR